MRIVLIAASAVSFVRKAASILMLAAALTACAEVAAWFGGGGFDPDTEMYMACAGYTKTLPVLTTLKPRMSAGQVAAVDTAIELVGPVCRAADDGVVDPADVAEVRDTVKGLIDLRRDMKE